MPQDILGLIVTLIGGSGGLAVIYRAYLDSRNNVAAREKEFNKGVIESLKDTQSKLARAEEQAREWMVYSSELIGFILKKGIDRSEIPKPPDEE